MLVEKMIRAISLLGFAGGFVLISQDLRCMAAAAFVTGADYLHAHSPYSYILAIAGALALMVVLARSATAVR